MPPRKAPAKKAPVKAREQKIDQFERFRARARGTALASGIAQNRPPYSIEGFDPPITVEWSRNLSWQIRFDELSRANDYFGLLRMLIGDKDFDRVVARFDTEPDGSLLLAGMVLHMYDHFLGPGVDEVGGTTAS